MDLQELGKNLKNDELVQAIEKMQSENKQENTVAFFQSLEKAVMIIPATFAEGTKLDKNGKPLLEGKVNFNFALLRNNMAQNFVPCFTSDAELDKSDFGGKKRFQRVLMSSDELKAMIVNSNGSITGIVINPSSHNVAIPFKPANSGSPRQERLDLNNVNLIQPKYPPYIILDKASELMKAIPEVNKAYLFMVEEKKGDEASRYLILIDSEGEVGDIANQMVTDLRGVSEEFKAQVIIGDAKVFGEKISLEVKPFYTKGE